MTSQVVKKIGITGAIMAVVLGIGAIVHHHFYPVRVWKFSEKPVRLLTLPFGRGSNQVTQAQGLDGQFYGPLGFMVKGGQLVIADTYGRRIVIDTHPWRSISTGNLLPEDIVGTEKQIFFADNHTLGIYRVILGKPRKIIQLSPDLGYTQMIWHLATDGNTLLVEGVKLGKGQWESWLRQYSDTGKLLHVLNMTKSGYNLSGQSLSSLPIGVSVRSFTVSPNQELVVELASKNSHQRVFRVYNAKHRMVRQAALFSRESINHSQIMGVNKMGWIYVGINLTEPGKAMVAVLRKNGQTMFRRVHSVPVASWVYGAVSPSGSLYLLQSTTKEYCIVKWSLKSKDVWSWNGRP